MLVDRAGIDKDSSIPYEPVVDAEVVHAITNADFVANYGP